MKRRENFSSNIGLSEIRSEPEFRKKEATSCKAIKISSYNNTKPSIKNINISKNRNGKKHRIDCLKPICWIIVPAITVTLLVLDALGIYTFNVVRLTVLGIVLLVTLLPFFSEIRIKDISVKRSKEKSNINT